VRFALIRGWAALATAILAAVAADVSAEFAENGGWLGGALRDNQHEAVLPALLLGTSAALSLIFFVMLARIGPGDPLLGRANHSGTRLVEAACSFCGSVLCVIAMEGYETRFGGLSPFDPRSVVMSHALPLIAAFLVTGAIVHCVLRAAIRAASHASSLVGAVFAGFLRKLRSTGAPAKEGRVSAFVLYVVHVPHAIAGARGLRAPPRSIPSYCFTA
jgi:hypothetical protein